MKQVIGFVLILVGIFVGLYVGGWVMFVGGIMQGIEAVRADVLVAKDVAMAIGRIVCAGLVGTICVYAFGIPGYVLIVND